MSAPRKGLWWKGVAVAAAVACAVPASAPASAARRSAPVTVPPLAWRPCADAPGFSCATARVPLDHLRPDGRTIELAVIRRRATDPDRRVGSLFFNPGGPGNAAAGTAALPAAYGLFPRELRERFDIVSWDPRGVGRSTAVRCFRSAEEFTAWAERVPDGFPVGAREQKAWTSAFAELGRLCERRAPTLLRHVSTADTARDLDLLRRAVGDRKLSYLGVSYGTFLGATYANLFPRKVRAMVLDGNVDPVRWVRMNPELPTELRQTADTGSARTLSRFLELCGRTTRDHCAFSAGTPQATRDKYEELLRRLRERPRGEWTYAATVAAVVNGLYVVDPGWSELAQNLQALWEGRTPPRGDSDGAPRAPRLPGLPGTNREPSYPEVEPPLAVECSESPNPRDPSLYPRFERYARARSGDVAGYWTWLPEPCATWPARAARPYTGPWNRSTVPVLTVNTTHDPATPYPAGVAATRHLGNARLITVRGYGHTTLLNPSTCVGRHEVRYVLTGALPPRDTVCRQDARPFTSSAPAPG
ncbi:alpha/beta hydrolase [Streptomyces sp. NPDC059506]|uniref:alpha/beta hydrolase n=1 Tax=unclassified Streptomyces TaxID=2593676 RepID=UPI002174F670|nr:alpha/beta hydrolase [Streptomyces sp. SCUT-3]